MTQVHDFGEMVPVCVGSMRVGGRDLDFGEHVPEAWKWSWRDQQMLIKAGKLAFVTKAQAEEMTTKAETNKQAEIKRLLEKQIAETEAAAKTLDTALADHDHKRQAIATKAESARKAVAEARTLLKSHEKGAPAEAIEKVLNAKNVVVERQITPETAKPKEVKTPDLEIKDRVAAIVSELGPPNGASLPQKPKAEDVRGIEALGIEINYSKMPYRELQKVAVKLGVSVVGKSKNELVAAVVEQAKLKRAEDKQIAEAIVEAEAGKRLVKEASSEAE